MGVLDDLVAPQRDPEQEPQRRDGLIDGRNANAARRQMQLVASHVLETRRIRRSPEKRREVLDPLHIVMLGLRRELADRHVFDHAPAQRAHRLVGHGDAPVLSEGCEPLISRQDAPSRYRSRCAVAAGALPRERFSPMALLRRPTMSAIAPLLGDKRTSNALRRASWFMNTRPSPV